MPSVLEEVEQRSGVTLHAFVNDSLVAWSGGVPFAPETLIGMGASHVT